jgi:hypothetical protein
MERINTLHELLDYALEDLRKAEADPRITIDMHD